MLRRIILTVFTAAVFSASVAQHNPLTQTIRGTVTDKITSTTLPGANIIVLGSDPILGTASDINGSFRIDKVPVGKHTLQITFMGYKQVVIPNVVVNSGKETVLNVSMEEDFVMANEVVISAEKNNKHIPINEMAAVSARTFSVEETQKYAAAVNDPGRMASSFAGVVSSDDGNNNISIRGNAPNQLVWRMEGVEIPNPNHFSAPGASGGGISILSAQTMSNSDFLTGAFPAEYGNALSGVFDIKLRKGNNQKREYTFQAGFLGVDAAAEGPFRKGYNGSYLINYRYSTLSMLREMGVNVGDASTDFQDISFNFFLPTKKAGNFSIFGFGGLSSQHYEAKKDSAEWEEGYERFGSRFISNTGAAGVTHGFIVGDNTYIRTVFSASSVFQKFNADRLNDEYVMEERHDERAEENKYTLTTVVNYKFSARHSIRSGYILNRMGFGMEQNIYDKDNSTMFKYIDDDGSAWQMQLFAQSSYHLNKKLVMHSGVHFSHFDLNNTYSIEPRLSFRYEFNSRNAMSIGYGLHSKTQPIGVYFAMDQSGNKPNKNLEMSKSHHLVMGYDRLITESLRLKTEVYYQSLFDIPVQSDELNSFSMVNVSEGYIAEPLVNSGTGRNYGLEVTAEQFLKRDFYFLLAGSLYDAKYKGSDGKLHNTRYNGNYSLAFTGGKEIKTGEKFRNRIIGFNIKTTWRGGFRDTPIDLDATLLDPDKGAVYDESRAFTIQYPAYFRTDIRVSVKRNRKNSTQTIALDIQNVSNRKNIYGKYFNEESKSIKTYYQTPLIPILSYKIDF